MSTSQLDKVYNSINIEDKWYQYWMDNNYFHSNPDPDKEPYTIVIPPPNVTGILTMGHVLNNTIQDILIRKARMEGKEACWIPGTDHASIATETKVVEMLEDKGIKKESLSRDEFLKYSWEWKEKYGGIIIQQLKRLGCSCDWDRERFTMDDNYNNAVLEAFIVLYNKGLIYKGFRLVNWCPVSQSAISDEEVMHEEVNGSLWHFRYPIKDSDEELIVATTRPETMLGDTAVAVHPKDKRFKHLIGKTVILPLTDREIPVIGDEFVDMEFGTGCIKVTPAHDPNDFDIGKRHDLEFINIMNEDASLNSNVPEKYRNLSRESAREKILHDLKSISLLEKTEEHIHKVGFSERGNIPIEYYMSSQWFLKMSELSKPASQAVNDGLIKFHPEHWVKTYNHWMENINDWCISRQLWWGHRIPVWYHNDDNDKIHVSLDGPRDPENWTQDEDVLDTWASSWLWPFAVHKWPENNQDLSYYYPTASLVTGPDIIFFWVARMIMSGFEFMGDLPFKDVYFTSILRDETGKKFSKSLGNSPDPFTLFDEYGTDAVRFGIMLMAPQGSDVLFSSKGLEVGRNFINKLWNASRFVLMNIEDDISDELLENNLKLPELWILNRLQIAIERVNKHLENFNFNEAAKVIYEFTWSDYCDWYIEIAKTSFNKKNESYTNTVKIISKYVLRNIIILLHPYAPFVTEEIWSKIKKQGDSDLIIASWPSVDKKWINKSSDHEMEILKNLISSVRTIRSQMNVPPNKLCNMVVQCNTKQKSILNSYSLIIESLAKIDNIEMTEDAKKPSQSATAIVDNMEIFIPLEGIIDFDLEKDRLQKRINELKMHLVNVKKKLENKDFLNRAPKNVILHEKEKKENMILELDKITKNLEMIQ
ncbi:MAG: valine--tRNA ligase [Candidatus Neomarinimicrobiota bacterium]|nr:valine--tRNA ligase [Candidatus Neomarinimicrobiota bacterium]